MDYTWLFCAILWGIIFIINFFSDKCGKTEVLIANMSCILLCLALAMGL
nr:MAG TPA: hypothetical protein [Caudoviricetes sp.]